MYIMSQDGKTVGEYKLITVKRIHGTGSYGLLGYCPIGSADRALFSEPIIGAYPGEERARQELAAIFAAMEMGADTYRLTLPEN